MNVRELIQQLIKLDMNRGVQIYNEEENKCYEAKLNIKDHDDYVYIGIGKLEE